LSGFELSGQRYAAPQQEPPQPSAPFVAALSQSRLSVSWPELSGFPVQAYELYPDDALEPLVVATNYYVATGFAPSTSHSFRLAYVLNGGLRSAKSDPAWATTWGEDLYGATGPADGLPDDWQTRFWGVSPRQWGSADTDSDGDGASNWQEFLAGTDPTQGTSVLRTRLTGSRLGTRLEWNTVPGSIYQVQRATTISLWTDYGAARFAAGTVDSLLVGGDSQTVFYRVKRVR
jgi:hypothetical protein